MAGFWPIMMSKAEARQAALHYDGEGTSASCPPNVRQERGGSEVRRLPLNNGRVGMNVKGFILEDDQGREFVMECTQPCARVGRLFQLRGWQRRRLVPLRSSEREVRRLVGQALHALDDLVKELPMLGHDRTLSVQLLENDSGRATGIS